METKLYDVYGVGNALVDTEIKVTDAELAERNLRKGLMALVSTQDQDALVRSLNGRPTVDAAGGSAANTMVGIAQFGGKAFYTGKVGNDTMGSLYRLSMSEVGVEFDVEADDGATGTCIVLVTPDGERTMQTSLGSSSALQPSDLHLGRIAQSKLLYVEGYLWGSPTAADAAELAMQTAREAGVPVALSLSDPAMVEFCGDALRRVTEAYVDILFCNEHEGGAFCGLIGRETILRSIGEGVPLVFMTCGGDGSLVWDRGSIQQVPGHKVTVVDTTGAGDVYASGVLYGLSQRMSPVDSAKLGSYASGYIVTRMGPRIEIHLAEKVPAILRGAHPLEG